jgi:hypothetical protein
MGRGYPGRIDPVDALIFPLLFLTREHSVKT